VFHLQHWCTELVDIEILDVGTWLTMQLIKEYNLLGNFGDNNRRFNLKRVEWCENGHHQEKVDTNAKN